MDIFSELKIGDKLSLEIQQVNTNVNNLLNTQLIDMDRNYLYISPPIYLGQKYSLRKGQMVDLFFYRKKGVYQFSAKVLKKIETNIVTFVLEPLGEIIKIQRRNYYRLPIVLKAVLKKNLKDEVLELDCVTKDLSGGGAKVLCKDKFQVLENITIDIYLDEEQVITLNGEILRVSKDIEKDSYELGIKFKEVDPIISDKIFAFIFERQRLMRKKGLI